MSIFDLEPFIRNVLGSYFNLIIAAIAVALATGANQTRWGPLRYALAWPLYAVAAIFISAWVFAVIWNNIIEPVGWLSDKATGEPPSVLFPFKQPPLNARAESPKLPFRLVTRATLRSAKKCPDAR